LEVAPSPARCVRAGGPIIARFATGAPLETAAQQGSGFEGVRECDAADRDSKLFHVERRSEMRFKLCGCCFTWNNLNS
jgi:hypothetical protein